MLLLQGGATTLKQVPLLLARVAVPHGLHAGGAGLLMTSGDEIVHYRSHPSWHFSPSFDPFVSPTRIRPLMECFDPNPSNHHHQSIKSRSDPSEGNRIILSRQFRTASISA